MEDNNKFKLIDSVDPLRACLKKLEKEPWIAIDTEFMREKTYFPRLSLIQLAIPGSAWCIDPQAIKDLTPLKEILNNPNITKVFHSASQDIEVLHHSLGGTAAPLFDTQIAASMLGYGEQVGYGNLVKAILNIELAKTQSRTDWSRRPLTEAQLSYAADDVIYLCGLYKKLSTELESKGRAQWLLADFENLANTDNLRPTPDRLLKRVKGHQRMKPRQQAIVRELAVWREDRAIKADKPRKWILGDEVVLDLARQTPNDIQSLSHVRGLHATTVSRYSEQLLACIKKGQAIPDDQLPCPPRKKKLKPQQQVVVDMLSALTSHAAQQADISAAVLANRKDLEKLVTGDDSPVLHGWKHVLAGELLEKFLHGEISLSIEENTVRVT